MGIKHATRVPGTNIKTSAVWAENHEIEGATIGTTEIADGSVTASKIASNAVITSKIIDDAVTNAKLGEVFFFVQSGTSPITFNHGMGVEPTGVVALPKAVQPYAFAYNTTLTQIKIYHNAVGSLTFSIIAWK